MPASFSLGLGLKISSKVRFGNPLPLPLPFDPASLFAGGENGAWYEPSTTTCFTDTAGTTAAGVGDAVARINDLSGNGNHATQATSSARPILARVPETGRRNQFTQTEDFTSGDWGSALNISASGNRLTVTATGIASYIGQDSKTVSGANVNTWEVRYVNNPWVAVNFGAGAATAAFFNIQTGAKGTEAFGYTGTITPLSGGWYRISVTGSPTVASSAFILICDGDNDITCTTGRSVDARFPQVEAGSTATAYQKVVDQYDITEAGVTSLEYLAFDGSDDGMATASIDFTATDKMSVFAGVEKESDSLVGVICETGPGDSSGSFGFYGPRINTKPDYGLHLIGSTFSYRQTPLSYAAPIANTLSGLFDISGSPEIIGRVDGAQVALTPLMGGLGDAGTGNFGNYPLYLGARDVSGTPSLFFDGKLFSLIVRGAPSTAGEISDTESYLATKSGVTL